MLILKGLTPVPIAAPDAFMAYASLTRRGFVLGTATAALLAATGRACARDGQAHRIVIAFPPGGTSTASTQPMLEPLGARLGASVTQVYKPGAGGDVAAIEVINALPDGRTLLFGHAGPLAINPHITVLRASRRRSTEAEFGLQMLHLPFAGGGPVQEALTRGALDVLCETGSNVVRHIREGRLKALAVMSKQRLATLPDVPTFAELGLADLDVSAWFGLLVPAATPDAIQDKLATAVLAVLEDAKVKQALLDIGGLPSPLGRQAFKELIADEYARWGKFIHDAGLKPTGTDAGASIGTPR